MNRIKTKNRCRLEPYRLDQLMMVKSTITASGTADDESDDESATYEDSAINIKCINIGKPRKQEETI